MSYGAMGNAAVFMQAESFGVGLLPRDDVFQTHVITTQAALKRYPRSAAGCDVTTPGSIIMADRNLGLAPGANIGDEAAVFEATHGTAPKYAGQDKVNPSSVILSGDEDQLVQVGGDPVIMFLEESIITVPLSQPVGK